jgi:flagellin
MSISIQTNVNSLLAQENLRVNSEFQTRTIQRLTSGYRINSSGDDAAGLAVANQFRSQTAELTQGVRNANDGISQLQIIDGGLSNVSTMLDRLNTLATQSASQTFTGDRATLNNEYQALLTEINRQADNIGLGANNATNAKNVGVFIGGGQDSNTNSTVNVNLTGSGVGAVALGLDKTDVLNNGPVTLGTPNVAATAIGAGQTVTFNITTAGAVQPSPIVITGTGAANDTVANQVQELNTQLQSNNTGITASLDTNGTLQFTSASAFSVSAVNSDTVANLTAAGTVTGENTGLNNYQLAVSAGGTGNTIQIAVGGTTVTANVAAGDGGSAMTQSDVDSINAALKAQGVTSVSAVLDQDAAGNPGGISFQGSSSFTVANNFAAGGSVTNPASSTAATIAADPNVAINVIAAALKSLGTTQGKVGTGENALNYAINLAQSQISNFSAAQSQIRDADVATEAANLTKAQVLQQSSIAAMAQANSAPQAILKLLQ